MNRNFQNTVWGNPTTHVQRFQLHYGPGADPDEVTIAPGETAEVPSIFDDAICTVRDGVIVGGLAPLLVAKDRKPMPLHEALAKAAALGDAERKLVATTGSSAGGSSLDAMVALQAQNAELEAKYNHLLAMLSEKGAPAPPKQQPPQNAPKGQQSAPG